MQPIILYSIVWMVVILLQSMRILDFYFEPNYYFILIQISIVLITAITHLVKHSTQNAPKMHLSNIYLLDWYLSKLTNILFFMFVLDMVYSGGVPLAWVLTGSDLKHVDFGIPTFHGAFHGLILFYSTCSYMLYLFHINAKKNIFRIIIFMLYCVVAFNRGLFVIFIIQTVFVCAAFSNYNILKIKNILVAFFSIVGFAYLFGLLGDIRQGENPFLNSVRPEWEETFVYVPKQFLWFYAYATGGLNTLYYNLEQLSPNWLPIYTLSKLVPTLIHNITGLQKEVDSFSLADNRITIATAFQGPVSDFGLLGVYLIVPIVLLTVRFYYKSRNRDPFSIFMYGVLMQSLVMTPYVDTVLYLPFLLQIMLGYFCLKKCNCFPKCSQRK